MKRREFIAGFASASIAGPSTLWGQQGEGIRRIGVLSAAPANSEVQSAVSVFQQSLQQFGWVNGRNVRFDIRWGSGDASQIRRHAADLVALAPDVILAIGTAAIGPLMRTTRTVPIVFNNVADPVGAGYVESMAHPGGNATGFIQFEYTVSGKWLELLKEIAPDVTRVAVLRDPELTGGIGQFAVIQAVASTVRMDISAINLRNGDQIERAVAAFAHRPNGGLILTASALSTVHRDLIISLAARHRLPAVYYRRNYADHGGLISYGYTLVQQYRDSAAYVDRILKGEKPGELQVQAPAKYELVINLKTAKALGIVVPPTLLAQADEVIE